MAKSYCPASSTRPTPCAGRHRLGTQEPGREEAFEIKDSSNGKHYFVLKATNAQIIGQSQLYSSLHSAQQGCDSVRRNAADADLEDESARPAA